MQVGQPEVAGVSNVVLAADHPGFADPEYRARRDRIAQAAIDLPDGVDARHVDYSADDDRTWATASTALAELHAQHACAEYLAGVAALDLATDRVPQLAEVSLRLQRLTGWRFRASPGLAPIREFYGALAGRHFMSTQYVRHPSVPLYTPEPDVIHELIGHANGLADQRFADLYEVAGKAGRRARDDEELECFSRTFWFTLEFGVVEQAGDLKAYGAGLLSSFGEMQVFADAEIRPWDPDEMAVTAYDIDVYQPVLFAAPSFDRMVDDLTEWFGTIG